MISIFITYCLFDVLFFGFVSHFKLFVFSINSVVSCFQSLIAQPSVWQLFSTPDHRSSIVHCQQTSLSSGRKGPRDRKLVWRAKWQRLSRPSRSRCPLRLAKDESHWQLTLGVWQLSNWHRRLTMGPIVSGRLPYPSNFWGCFVNRKSLEKRYLPGPINAELHADYESWYRFLSRIAFLMCYFLGLLFSNFSFFHYSINVHAFAIVNCPTVSLTVVQYARPSIVNCPLSTNVLVVWPQRTSRPQVSLTRSCDNDWAVHREVDVLCGGKGSRIEQLTLGVWQLSNWRSTVDNGQSWAVVCLTRRLTFEDNFVNRNIEWKTISPRTNRCRTSRWLRIMISIFITYCLFDVLFLIRWAFFLI